ncbi:hypothetical protein LEP1GSC060_0908 [Leptospira weilii serovar Ranarum str. ICFT]|uniref:Uncharacterized protein n=1 Tax=Leptospira weilii serovar Ranarum str. ICFT TaxID=1218598 RepID=N1WLA7_9LEPT|nr:hypothetical protein LEP1GSC060_0908 [Leptospira weilii serovar Ranarum str. ICFT]
MPTYAYGTFAKIGIESANSNFIHQKLKQTLHLIYFQNFDRDWALRSPKKDRENMKIPLVILT